MRVECPACGNITLTIVGVRRGIEDWECKSCHHYQTFLANQELEKQQQEWWVALDQDKEWIEENG